MKAMILAAGLGTRLLPLTRDIAKPAIPFANRPLIHYGLEWLIKNGVDEVVINLHHHPQSIVSAVRERSWPLKIHFSHEPEILGTAGGVKKAEKHFKKGTFVMVNSDSLFEIDLGGPLAFHRENAALATMVLKEKSSEDFYGTVVIDDENRVINIKGRGVSQKEGKGTIFTGVHLFEPEVLEWIPQDRLSEINQEVYPRLIQEGKTVRGFVTDAFWAEVGSHKTYLRAHRDFLTRHDVGLVSESRLSGRVALTPPLLIGRGCHIGDEARIGPSAVVGHNCHVGKGAVVGDSVIWNGVTIGPGVHIKRSIVGHRTTIEAETHLEGVVACGEERKRIEALM